MADLWLRPARLKPGTTATLGAGEFLELRQGTERRRFLGGYVPDEGLLIHLEDMQIGRPADWSPVPGLVIATVGFEVDPNTVRLAREEVPAGALLVVEDRIALLGSRGSAQRRWLPVDAAKELPRDIMEDDLVFTRWRLLTGTGEEQVELFKFDGAATPPTAPSAARAHSQSVGVE